MGNPVLEAVRTKHSLYPHSLYFLGPKANVCILCVGARVVGNVVRGGVNMYCESLMILDNLSTQLCFRGSVYFTRILKCGLS